MQQFIRERIEELRLLLNNRTWEFANRVLQVTEDDSKDRTAMLSGVLSEGVARELMGFMKIHESLPKISQLIASPETTDVPKEPSVLFALTGSIAHNMDKDNASMLMKYVTRMPIEFQVVCMRESVRRNKTLMAHVAIQKWLEINAQELF